MVSQTLAPCTRSIFASIAAIVDAVDGDAVRQRVELRLVDLAMGAHAIAAQPAGGRQFEDAGEAAVVGEEQQAFGVDVEPADGDEPRQVVRQHVEDRVAALGIAVGGHQAARLVEQEQPRALAPGDAAARPR